MKYEEIVKKIKACPKGKKPFLLHSVDTYEDKELTKVTGVSKKKKKVFKGEDGPVSYQAETIKTSDFDFSDEDDLSDEIHDVLYLKKDVDKKMDIVRDDKSPQTKKNHVGIEMEFISKLTAIELEIMLTDAGLEKYVTLKDDGSVYAEGPYHNSHELCILAPEQSIKNVVNKVCALLKGNSNVNKTCGLHVHLDMRNRDVDEAYVNLFAAQPLLYSMCPKSRYKNEYCKPTKTLTKDDWDGGDRYYGINKEAYHKYETIEVRIHSGTINPVKINNWVEVLLRIIKNGIKTEEDYEESMIPSYKVMKKKLKLSGKLEKYIQSRLKEFKENQEVFAKDFQIAA